MTAPADLPRLPRTVPDWHETAACRLFPELDWVDARGAQATACRVVCAACPVREACARDALERGEPNGIWGGLDRHDRKHVARRYGYVPPGDPPPHGTNSRRVKWGCDCAECRAAHAFYERERRARKRAQGRPVLLYLVRPLPRQRAGTGQYLLPLDLPAPDAAVAA